jgi:MFS family permease
MVLLLAATFVLAASHGVVFPLLADLQDAHHLPTGGLGLISGASFLTGLAGQLALSPLADRGRARLLVLGGLALSIVALVWFAVATELWQFVAARALSGLAVGCFQPAARAIVATLDPRHAGANLGRLASTELGGFVFGPVVGASLADQFGLEAPFVVLAVLAGAALVVASTRPLPTGRLGEGTTRGAAGDGDSGDGRDRRAPGRASLLKHRPVVVAALLALALFLPVGVYDSLWARYLDDLGASTLFIGVSLSLYGVPFVAFAATGGRLADRYGAVRAAVTGLAVIIPLTFVYGVLRSPWVIIGVAMFEAVAQAVAAPAAQAAMAQASPPGQVAAGQGLAGAMSLAGAGLAALGAAPLYDAAGPAAVFGAVTAIMAALTFTAARLARDAPTVASPVLMRSDHLGGGQSASESVS